MRVMERAAITETVDTNYKGGFVKCACGWFKEFGDGFNQYHIANCPACTPQLKTRDQRKVTTGRPGNLKVEIGRHTYFVLDNGIHVRYSAQVSRTYTGLSERSADSL